MENSLSFHSIGATIYSRRYSTFEKPKNRSSRGYFNCPGCLFGFLESWKAYGIRKMGEELG
jgi:hypothetical protein